jgi:hypothetical protein
MLAGSQVDQFSSPRPVLFKTLASNRSSELICSLMAKSKSKRLPTIQKIDAGCYIDFEGFAPNEHTTSPPPVLVGIFRDGLFKQVVFTKAYRWAAKDSGVKHLVEYCEDRGSFLKELADSTSGSKPLFAFSEHERTVIKKEIGHDVEKRFSDVRAIAKRFFNKYPNVFEELQGMNEHSLKNVAAKVGLSLTQKLEKGGMTRRLREVREYSQSAKKWAAAPDSARRSWREVLEHNRVDTTCLIEILRKLAKKKEQIRCK